ncbi:MAG TPA: hypothetical protein VGS41_04380 [Chthonomonadales bacterium]|nr:hypothetical protein [Chthonomonadales bacterium]
MITTLRTYSPAPSVRHADVPLYQLGWAQKLQKVQRGMGEVRAPKIPLHQLGWFGLGASASGGSQILQAGGAIGSKVVGSAVTSAASAAGAGAWAGPIGAAAAVAIGVIVGLIAAHEQRIKNAKNENAAASATLQSFYSIIQQTVTAYNAGTISQSDAISAMQQLDQATYTALRSQVGPAGTAWNSSTPGTCDKSCTVGCCLYNTWLHPDIYGGVPGGKTLGVIPALQNGGTTSLGGIGPGGKYGLVGVPAFTVTVNPPSATSSISGAVSSVESALTGGSSSMMPLLLLGGVAAFLFLR